MPSASASTQEFRDKRAREGSGLACAALRRVLQTERVGEILQDLGRTGRRERQDRHLREDAPQLAEGFVVRSRGGEQTRWYCIRRYTCNHGPSRIHSAPHQSQSELLRTKLDIASWLSEIGELTQFLCFVELVEETPESLVLPEFFWLSDCQMRATDQGCATHCNVAEFDLVSCVALFGRHSMHLGLDSLQFLVVECA